MGGNRNASRNFGAYNEALEAYNKIIEIRATPYIWASKGCILVKLQKYEVAYGHVTEIVPAYKAIQVTKSRCLLELDRPKDALKTRKFTNG